MFREMRTGFFFRFERLYEVLVVRRVDIVRKSQHSMEVSDLTLCLVQSDSRSRHPVLNYEKKRVKKKKESTPHFRSYLVKNPTDFKSD